MSGRTTATATTTTTTLLRIKELTVKYGTGENALIAVDNLSLDIPTRGYSLGIVGESGSGKTTLGMSILNALEPPGRIESGSIEYQGKNILEMRHEDLRKYQWHEVSMVFQSAMNSLNPVRPVIDPIVEALREHEKIRKSEARQRAIDLISQTGVPVDRSDNFPFEFSGGMRQRVVIALALALSPKLLIADEPTSALDVVTQKQILRLLKKYLSEKDLSLIFITHEISLLVGLVDNVLVMYKGEIVERGPLARVIEHPLHPYTEVLLKTVLTVGTPNEVLYGEDSLFRETQSIPKRGCKYAGICKYAFDRCRVERPKLLQADKEERWVACHKYN
jgi:oligopeptide/dipeptide ABC transporter ATP-binding protein